ncbi:GreA/GreB family elongation factor [Xylophilus sp. ASV27]|uniref:GreA/GreB family elongation factor n=1 Tax=Xylophilus sp. ASV27 TaxID=2795129 RepID=UPI0018EAD19A|nr:GreA/GreB family elongation factor [Xylophilus sp. ASV27]
MPISSSVVASSASSSVVPRTITELDLVRIRKRLSQPGALPESERAEFEDLLDNAEVVSSYAVPPEVVTMRSEVRIVGPVGCEERTVTLCYPEAADPAAGRVSVLSAMGMHLLGLSPGQTAHWTAPDGRELTAEVRAIVFQPEDSGDFLG